MEINAKINISMNQVVVMKQLTTGSYRISISDAKHLHNTGRITKSNRCFKRLVENDFDTVATLGWYQAERERLAAEKASSTDED